MLSMDATQQQELERRFRGIIQRAVSTGTFLNDSFFTGVNGSLNVEDFTQHIIEADDEAVETVPKSKKQKQKRKKKAADGAGEDEAPGTVPKRLTPAQIKWFLRRIDTNGDGLVDYREFLHFTYNADPVAPSVSARKSSLKNDELKYQVDAFAKELSAVFSSVVRQGKVADFRDIFAAMDTDGSGSVSHEEFVDGLRAFDFKVPPQVEQELLRRFDHDGDKSINYIEFVNFCLAYAHATGDNTGGAMAPGVHSSATSGALVAAIASHAGGGFGDADSVADRVRLALCRFAESQGGAKSVSQMFVKLNEQSMGGGVTALSLVSDVLRCCPLLRVWVCCSLWYSQPTLTVLLILSPRSRSWNCWPPRGQGLRRRRPAISSDGSVALIEMSAMATTSMS